MAQEITIEAEKMTLSGYHAHQYDEASGGAYAALDGGSGNARTTFGGEAGIYDLDLSYIDYARGSGTISVWVKNAAGWVKVGEVSLDKSGDGAKFMSLKIEGVQIDAGAEIWIGGCGDGYCEFAGLDRLTLTPVGGDTGGGDDCAAKTVTLLSENFDDATQQTVSNGYVLVDGVETVGQGGWLGIDEHGGKSAAANGFHNGALTFAEVSVTDIKSVDFQFKAASTSGMTCNSKFSVEVNIDGKGWTAVETFTGSGSVMRGDKGSIVSCNGSTLSLNVALPDGASKAQFRIVADFNSQFESICVDDVVITGEKHGACGGCGDDFTKIDFSLADCTVVTNQYDGVTFSASATNDVCYQLEAECMTSCNFDSCWNLWASGHHHATLHEGWFHKASWGSLATTFAKPSGTYHVSMRAWDEWDGCSAVKLKVNGAVVSQVVLNKVTGWLCNDWREFSFGDVAINAGDKVELLVCRDGCETVKIDYLKFSGSITKLVDAKVCNGVLAADGHGETETIVAEFSKPSTVSSLDVVGGNGGKIVVTFADGSTKTIGVAASNGSQTIEFGPLSNVAKIEVKIDGDAAIDNLCHNRPPVANDDPDAGKLCSDKDGGVDLDLIANDTDPDGADVKLTVTKIRDLGADGKLGGGDDVVYDAPAGQTTKITLSSGATLTIGADGAVNYDSSDAAKGTTAGDLKIGERYADSFQYAVSDGFNTSDFATASVKLCGAEYDAAHAAKLLLGSANGSVSGSAVLTVGDASTFFTIDVNSTGVSKFDAPDHAIAYCVSSDVSIAAGSTNNVQVKLLTESNAVGVIPNAKSANIINWILNQRFDQVDNNDGNGATYTEGEIQGAIWGFTDGVGFIDDVPTAFGTTENAREIYDLAVAAGANAENFQPGTGDIVGFLLETDDPQNVQPLIIGLEFDCMCG